RDSRRQADFTGVIERFCHCGFPRVFRKPAAHRGRHGQRATLVLVTSESPPVTAPIVGSIAEPGDTAYPDELLFAFVAAVGTQSDPIVEFLEGELEQWGYHCEPIGISDFFPAYVKRLSLPIELQDDPFDERVRTRMNAGNQICSKTKQLDFLALLT